MLPIVSINGTIVQEPASAISAFDRGLTLGDGIFETLKIADGLVWYLDRHLQRMRESAITVGITFPADGQQWIAQVLQRIEEFAIRDATLRITLTRGISETTGLRYDGIAPPTVIVTAYAAPKLPATLYSKGISVQVATNRRNDRSSVSHIKTTSYAESLSAFLEAQAAGYDDAIFLNTRDFVAEATASNVFVSVNGTIATPPTSHGALPGITRAIVLDTAQKQNIPANEREIGYDELLNADEIFLTSSVRGIVPVTRLAENDLGRGYPGEITQKIITAYNALTDRT